MPPKKAAAAPTAPAKRGRAASAKTAAPPAKAAKTAAATSASAVVRPTVDEHFRGSGQVYVDDGNVPWAVKLNQTHISANNNKYYIIQMIEVSPSSTYACFSRWGRVGEAGQNATVTGDLSTVQKAFAAKFKDKTKNDWAKVKDNHGAFTSVAGKYDLVETDVAAAPANVAVQEDTGKVVKVLPSKLESQLQSMLTIIFNKDMFKKQMKEKNIDANRMPLGKLTESQIKRGYEALEAIEKLVDKKTRTAKDTTALEELSSKFYTIIPHDFGRRVPPVIATAEMVKEKYDLLNLLNDIQIAVAVDEAAASGKPEENPIDKQYKELGCKLEVVDPKSAEYAMVDQYTNATQGYRKCKIRRLFRVDRPEDKQRMQQKHGKEKKGRYLLWHGTNIAVVAAILKTGLRIMPHAGGRVGRGLYFATENGKSSSYVGVDGKTGIMFLAEVCMGEHIHRITKDDSSLCLDKVNGLKATSVLACGRQEPDMAKAITMKGEWGDITVPQSAPVERAEYKSSSFFQSEYLVYEESRARIKYLLEMDF